MASSNASIFRAQYSMNGFGSSPSPAHLKQKASQEEEVVRRKPRPRERGDGEQSKPHQQPQPRAGRLGVIFKDARTNLILKQVFCELCQKDMREVEREVMRLADRTPKDGQLVRKVSGLIVEFIKETEQISLNLETFNQQEGWNLHAGNIYTEFSKVALETFKSAVNWGRILMFLGFAASFTVYLEKDVLLGSADSVLQWTCQVVEEDLGEYITSHGGWVSRHWGWVGIHGYIASTVLGLGRRQGSIANTLCANFIGSQHLNS